MPDAQRERPGRWGELGRPRAHARRRRLSTEGHSRITEQKRPTRSVLRPSVRFSRQLLQIQRLGDHGELSILCVRPLLFGRTFL